MYPHESSFGFDTLALEGSLTQTWLAQEVLVYRSTDPPSAKIAHAQELAWFRLWRTQPMRELMTYVDATQHTTAPLYLTSFDIEIGQSSAFGEGEDVVAALFEALHAFGPPPDAAREADWNRALTPLVHCFENYARFTAHRDEALAAIEGVQRWTMRSPRRRAHSAAGARDRARHDPR